jgi:hypothetical protein
MTCEDVIVASTGLRKDILVIQMKDLRNDKPPPSDNH